MTIKRPSCPAAQLPSCPAAQLPSCPAAQLPSCPAAQLPSCPAAPSAPALQRHEQVLLGLNTGRLRGAEVGPLDRPLVKKTDGQVYYVDHCDTQALRDRWSTDPGVEVSKLHVDAVWGADTLRESLEQAGAFADCSGLDYFVASHVVEHVPDLVSWLREVHAVLTTAGSLRLAVPDKRYCFDILRRTSSLADVLDAFVRKRRVPSSSRILDFALNMAPVDVGAAWRSDVRPEDLQPAYTPAQALSLAEDAEQNGTYHDVHCWVFTPESFATLMLDLCRCRLLDFGCEWLVPTARDTFEFFVAMKPERDPVAAMASWQRALDTLR